MTDKHTHEYYEGQPEGAVIITTDGIRWTKKGDFWRSGISTVNSRWLADKVKPHG